LGARFDKITENLEWSKLFPPGTPDSLVAPAPGGAPTTGVHEEL
jgi:hypothetical protein